MIPYKECLANKNVMLATHPCGGHLGFFQGLNPQQWFAEPVIGYIDSLEQFYAQKTQGK